MVNINILRSNSDMLKHIPLHAIAPGLKEADAKIVGLYLTQDGRMNAGYTWEAGFSRRVGEDQTLITLSLRYCYPWGATSKGEVVSFYIGRNDLELFDAAGQILAKGSDLGTLDASKLSQHTITEVLLAAFELTVVTANNSGSRVVRYSQKDVEALHTRLTMILTGYDYQKAAAPGGALIICPISNWGWSLQPRSQ